MREFVLDKGKNTQQTTQPVFPPLQQLRKKTQAKYTKNTCKKGKVITLEIAREAEETSKKSHQADRPASESLLCLKVATW